MTYAGLSTLFLRLLGFLAVFGVLFSLLPAMLSSGRLTPLLMITGIGLIPGVLLIVGSKPLGRILASGIE